MRDAVEYVEREGISPLLRWVLALVALLFGAGMLAIASSTEAPAIGYAFGAFCLFVAAGCATQGRVRRFILSTLGLSLFGVGLAYIYSQATSGPLVSRRSDPSLLNSILFMLALGIPGLGYAVRAKFGLGTPAAQQGAAADEPQRVPIGL